MTTPSTSDIVHIPPGQLTAWPRNPRKHTVQQRFRLKAGMSRCGFTVPVIADEAYVILAGHERVEAAKELGFATVPVRILSGLSQAEKRAYVISDNKLALLSKWNPADLKDELQLLIEEDFDIELTGFSTAETDLMFEVCLDPKSPDDFAPAPAATPVSKPGHLWTLGSHRLFCCSALDESSYAAVLGSEPVQMCITDPPYNVKIDGHVCGQGKTKHKEFAMAAGEMSCGQFTDFLATALRHVHGFSAAGAIAFVFMDWRHVPELLSASFPIFGPPRQLCVWNKDNAGMGTFYRSKHELVYVFKKGDTPHINNFELGQHGRYRTNVWDYPMFSPGI